LTSAPELSGLLADLYATPLEPERWNAFLAGGGQNHDAKFFRLYSEHYGSSDPFRPGLAKPPVIGLNHGSDLVDQAQSEKPSSTTTS
jgi:hypothetical protein